MIKSASRENYDFRTVFADDRLQNECDLAMRSFKTGRGRSKVNNRTTCWMGHPERMKITLEDK